MREKSLSHCLNCNGFRFPVYKNTHYFNEHYNLKKNKLIVLHLPSLFSKYSKKNSLNISFLPSFFWLFCELCPYLFVKHACFKHFLSPAPFSFHLSIKYFYNSNLSISITISVFFCSLLGKNLTFFIDRVHRTC